MALSYFDAGAWNTTGSINGTAGRYKDVSVTGAQVGDLLVAVGGSESYDQSGGTRSVATQSGSTSAWTISSPATVLNSDTDAIGGWATVSASGTVVVRVQVRVTVGSIPYSGAGVWLIPAAEVGATYGWVGSGFAADADGQVSATLAASSTLIYAGFDWAALTVTSTASTPAGATYRQRVTAAGRYSVWLADWTTQASGTRNYGPAGLSGGDFSGVLFRMDTAGGATNFDGTATLAGTGSITATARAGVSGSVSIAGANTIASAASVGKGAGASIAGTGSIVATASVSSAGVASVTIGGAGSISASAVVGKSSDVTISGADSIVSTAIVGESSSVAIAGVGSVTASAVVIAGTGSIIAGVGAITATATVGKRQGVAISGAGVITATASVGSSVSVSIAGVGTVTASAHVQNFTDRDITVTARLEARLVSGSMGTRQYSGSIANRQLNGNLQ